MQCAQIRSYKASTTALIADVLWWASCHFRFRSVVDHAMPCYSMKMEVPGLADSLQQCLCVNSGIYAGDVLDTDPGWQQSKLIWALSAEVGSASRMHCTGLWHVKAAQQPFVWSAFSFPNAIVIARAKFDQKGFSLTRDLPSPVARAYFPLSQNGYGQRSV